MLYVYMPIIRQQTAEFVDLWNIHRIRKQRDKLYLPTGKPWLNYYTPSDGVHDYDVAPNSERLKRLQRDVEEYGRSNKYNISSSMTNKVFLDLNEYLLIATINKCQELLEEGGYTVLITYAQHTDEKSRIYEYAYIYLWSQLSHYVDYQMQPSLKLCTKPEEAMEWKPIPKNLPASMIPVEMESEDTYEDRNELNKEESEDEKYQEEDLKSWL
jgi:hypothetical protein